MAGKIKRRLGFGCGITTLLGLGFLGGFLFAVVVLVQLDRKTKDWRSEESQQFITDHFQKILTLTPEQREQIAPVIEEGLKKRWELRRDYYLETDRLFVEDYVPRIGEFLSSEQKQLLKQRLERWREENSVTGIESTTDR